MLALVLRGEQVTPMWPWVPLLPASTSVRDGICRQTDINSNLSFTIFWLHDLGKWFDFSKAQLPHLQKEDNTSLGKLLQNYVEIGTLFNHHPIISNKDGTFR